MKEGCALHTLVETHIPLPPITTLAYSPSSHTHSTVLTPTARNKCDKVEFHAPWSSTAKAKQSRAPKHMPDINKIPSPIDVPPIRFPFLAISRSIRQRHPGTTFSAGFHTYYTAFLSRQLPFIAIPRRGDSTDCS